MTTFTEDFQRRLRAVLAKHARIDIPTEAVVVVEADATGNQDDSRGLDCDLVIRTQGAPYASYSYPEPGAWPRLLADLESADVG